jgi:formylglycine-generating enzyme required for sulfatase activity
MPSRLLLAALLLLTAPLLATAQDARALKEQAAAEQRLAAARDRLTQARAALTAAQDGLQVLVEELKDDYQSLVAGPDAPSLKNDLVLAMLDTLPTADARIAAAGADGRRASRGTRGRVLRESFADPVADASSLDDRLAHWVSRQVADGLAGRASLEDVDATTLLRLLEGLFEDDENWYVFWNRTFHADLPDAHALAAAQAEYESAGLALDRERNPERYGPRGERAPLGMVVVPGGNYELGPNSGFKRPGRKTTLQPFALDRREVTRREYKTFLEAQTPLARRDLLPRGWNLNGAGVPSLDDDSLAEHPVVFVSWEQAAAYAQWVGKRLPTEDEWEAAAGGTKGRAWPWGDEFAGGMCNGAGASTGTLPVESFPHARSAAGCFDMAGNVWEWTSTLEEGKDVDVLPDGPVNVIIRGGGWRSERDKLTCRHRWIAPGRATFAHPGFERPIGFRCAQDL